MLYNISISIFNISKFCPKQNMHKMIRYCRQTESYGAMKIFRKFERKEWATSGVSEILNKVDQEDSSGCKAGSGRSRLAKSQEETGAYEAPAEIASTIDISESSVRRITKHDLGLASLKLIKEQKLREADETNRVEIFA